MIKIEVLYSEVCNYYGDTFNITYLKRFKDIEIVYTSLNEIPKFTNEKIDMIYMSPMTENMQEIVIKKLKPYKKIIKKLIDDGTFFYISGNALEIFGKYILADDKKIIGLGITKLYAKRNMLNRFNSLFLGEFNDIKIVGFKSSFSESFGKETPLFKVIKGLGINKKAKVEGVRINNFFASYVLGPIFILNPLFTKYILDLLGVKYSSLEFEEEIMNCYKIRLKEFEDFSTKYD